MAKWIYTAAAAGFLVGMFWLVMSFVFFTAEPSGPWWSLYIMLLAISCPAWFVPIFPFTPVVNAAIYTLTAFCGYKLRQSGRPLSERPSAS